MDPNVHFRARTMLVQCVLGIVGVSVLILVVLIYQRDGARQAGIRTQEDLEARMAERTSALRDSELRFSALVESGASVIVGLAPDHRIVTWNRAAEEVYGVTQAEAMGKDYLVQFLPPEARNAVAKDIDKVLSGEPTQAFENEVIHRNGKRRTLLWNVCRFADEQQRPLGLLAVGQDITERKQMEMASKQINEDLRRLSAHQESVINSERARIAREIHDDLGATMTSVLIDIRMALAAGAQAVPAIRDRLVHAQELLASANEAIQRIVSDLRPSALDHLGVWGGIEWLANDWQARTGLSCEISIDSALNQLSIEGDRATALFRIVQESLTNVTRHANASRVELQARRDSDGVRVEIRDNGIGIGADRLLNLGSPGLVGMRERAYRFGGTLQVTSEVNMGTVVILRLPV